MTNISSYLKDFIERNIDLIESQNYKKLLKRCLPSNRKELRTILKDIDIDVSTIDLSDSTESSSNPEEVNTLIKNKLSELKIDYLKVIDKNNHVFVYHLINIDKSEIADIEDSIQELLEENSIAYDYISVHPSSEPKIPVDLVVRIKYPKVQ